MKHKQFILDTIPNSIFNDPIDWENWEKLGKPHVWHFAESKDNYEVWIDTGKGITLLTDGVEYSTGKYMTILKNCVALDRDYYGVVKYIWL